jgi:competence protein ComEC
MEKNKKSGSQSLIGGVIFLAIGILDVLVLRADFFTASTLVAHDYFLDVGQGDSELVVLPGNIAVMTDAGPRAAVVGDLQRILPGNYIDVAIISHPQLDHFNGYNFILDHYHIGAFIYNGRDDDPPNAAWSGLKVKIKDEHIPLITLGRRDSIHYASSEIDILSPNLAFDQSAELNDTGFVELVKTPEFRTLFTADTGFNVENWLLSQTSSDLRANVLKVGHHGSSYSSGDAFLRAVNPDAAVIEVGAKNNYGHPGSSTLARLASSTDALVLRTDQNGTIEIYPENGKLKIIKDK